MGKQIRHASIAWVRLVIGQGQPGIGRWIPCHDELSFRQEVSSSRLQRTANNYYGLSAQAMTILIHGMSCKDRILGVLSHGSPFKWLAPDLLCYLGAPAFSFSFSSFATSVAGQHGAVSIYFSSSPPLAFTRCRLQKRTLAIAASSVPSLQNLVTPVTHPF